MPNSLHVLWPNQDLKPAFDTLAEAYNEAQDGDTIFLGPGTFHFPSSVSRSLTLVGYSRELTILGPHDGFALQVPKLGDKSCSVTLKNLSVSHSGQITQQAVYATGPHHITVESCTLRSSSSTLIWIGEGVRLTVRDCDLGESPVRGIYVASMGGPVLVEDCLIHNNQWFGITIINGDLTLRNTHIYNCNNEGLSVQAGKALVQNCRIYDNLKKDERNGRRSMWDQETEEEFLRRQAFAVDSGVQFEVVNTFYTRRVELLPVDIQAMFDQELKTWML